MAKATQTKGTAVVAAAKAGAVATKGKQDVSAAGTDAELLAEIAADKGGGFEEANKDAYAIPFVTILQDLSPQVKKKMAGYVEGASVGDIFNTVSQKVGLKTIEVIPCYYSQVMIEWVPRGKGGGFVAAHPATTALVRQATRDGGKNILPNGNELSDTRQHFVLVVNEDGTAEEALIAMKSTQLKKSRRWMTQMRSAVIEIGGKLITPPSFAWQYTLGVEEEANDEGSWWSWTVLGRTRVTNADLYRRAKAFNETMKAGAVKVNYDELQTQGNSAAGGEGRDPGASPEDNDIRDM